MPLPDLLGLAETIVTLGAPVPAKRGPGRPADTALPSSHTPKVKREGSTLMGGRMPSRLTPFRQWCQEVGISVQTGYREVNRGRLVVVKVGRRTFVRESDSEAWMRSLETLAPHGTPRRAQAHTESQGEDERHKGVGSEEMEHPNRLSLPRAREREGHDADVPPWELGDIVPPARARGAQPPLPENGAPNRSDFDEVRDLPGCLRRSPALPVLPPAGQSEPTPGTRTPETDSVTRGGAPTPTAEPSRWPTDKEIAEAYPTMGHASSPERDFLTALRSWRRDRRWVTPSGRVEEHCAPTPEEFIWWDVDRAARLRREGDPWGMMAAAGQLER